MDNVIDFKKRLNVQYATEISNITAAFTENAVIRNSSWADVALAAFFFSQFAYDQYQKETGDKQTYKEAFGGAL